MISAAQRPSSVPLGSLDFFWLLVRRDLQVRYAGSSLGAVWNLIHPLLMIAIYMTIFSSIMSSRGGVGAGQVDYGALNYGVHLCAGLIPWMLFGDVLQRSTGVLIENAGFLRKVAFPPLVLYASVLFNALVVQGCGFLVFLGALLMLGHPFPLAALLGLPVMLLFGLTALGLGLILSGLNVFFRDTAQVLAIVMQLLFWFAPIVYDKSLLHKIDPATEAQLGPLLTLGRGLMAINPFERYINGVQTLFGSTSMPATAVDWAVVVLMPILTISAGLLVFRRMLPEVRDCL